LSQKEEKSFGSQSEEPGDRHTQRQLWVPGFQSEDNKEKHAERRGPFQQQNLGTLSFLLKDKGQKEHCASQAELPSLLAVLIPCEGSHGGWE